MVTSQHALYIGSYAPADQPGIYACTFDEATANLVVHGSFAGIVNPSFVIVHPNRRWLYAVSETSQQTDGMPVSVWALRCMREPWSMEPINRQMSGGDLPCHLGINSTGQWLLVSNYGSGTVSVVPILSDGALGEMSDLNQHQGSGPHPERQEGPHVHSATFSPDERFVIVADLGVDALMVYTFDASAGRLLKRSQISTRPGAGPRFKVFHPSGPYVYIAHELDNTVVVYDYDMASGTLRERQIVETLPPNTLESTTADIEISPAGDRLYVSNRGDNSISIFKIEEDGRLTRLAIRSSGGRCPRDFAITPSGRFLLVANQESGEVVVLPMLGGLEGLGAPITRAIVPGASCLQFVKAYW